MGRLIENMQAAIDLSRTLTGEIERANAATPSVVEGGTNAPGGGDQPVNITFNELPGVNPQAIANVQILQGRILDEIRGISIGMGGRGGGNALKGAEFRMKGT